MALKFADILVSNNPKSYGIARAIEISGHKTVSSLEALYKIPDCILSDSGDNTGDDAIGQEWYVVSEASNYKLISWDNRHSEEGWKSSLGEYVTEDQLQEELKKKQDKLTAGTGINISEDNIISCTLDTEIFIFVDELPPLKEAKFNKIYILRKTENEGENQKYIEYILTTVYDEAGFESRAWEKLGEYDLGIELEPYLKKEDAEKLYVKKTDIINSLEGGESEQVLGASQGKELKDQIDSLNENTVHSITATEGKGIIIEGTKNDPTIGILRDESSEDFLSLSENGLKLSGVQEAINAGDNKVKEEYKSDLDEMQSHTEYLYNINTLFPNEGMGDNKNQWTLTRAISKLDSLLSDEERLAGIKIKFLSNEDKWRTYTFYGESSEILDESKWNYDLTSKDFIELATTNLPTATQEANGTMSKEDKKKFDTLSEGIEEGVSIVDKINEIVEDTKEVIDNYTVNGYKISENPVLNKEDVGLGNVDNTSDMDKPISTATQEALDELISHTKVLFNIVDLFPGEGQGDNKDQWNLQSAISRLSGTIDSKYKVPGVKIKLITEDGKWRTYTFYGEVFTDVSSWKYDLTSKDFTELATVDLPTATQEANGTMSKEDKKKLDTLSEGIGEGVSIVDKINEIVEDTKEVIDNYTVNGYKISENPVLNKTDIGLGNVTDDAQVKRSEMGVANGVATLDNNGKVPDSQLPDSVLGNVKFMGTWNASTNTPELVEGNEEDNGHYYIVDVPGSQFGFDFDAGDWVINSNGSWSKVDNVDAVKSVNGKDGIVELVIEDIPNLRDELDSKASQVDLEAHTSNTENPHNVTKEQVGLGNVDNTSDMDKPISTATLDALKKLQEHSDIVYNVTSLFPGEGQGDNKDQWTIQLAISKLDSYADPKYRVPGVKCKFLDTTGVWRTYTYYGEIFADSNSWSYDLTSKDFTELATTNLPTATQEANGTMSKEDKKKLDTLSEGIDENTSIKDIVDEAVNVAKEELQGNIDTVDSKVEAHIADKSNPHQVTKEQVGLGNVTNDAQVKRAEMGIAEGVATLDESGKVPSSQLPDSVLGNVRYSGTWDASKNIPELTDNSPENSGKYYVVSIAGSQFGINFEPGDWVINNGGNWAKVDNVDAVKSVNGKSGEVVIEIADISGLTDELNSKAAQSDLDSVKELANKLNDSLAQPDGIATLDSNGKLVESQIPSKAINVLEGKYINETTFNDRSDSPYTPALGIIYVDITDGSNNNIYRWNGTAFVKLCQTGDIEQDILDHIDNKSNPHEVTKEQIGLGNVTNDAQVKRTEMGVAEGVATLDINGKIPTWQLPGQVDEVFGIDHFVDSKDQIPTSRLDTGTTYYAKLEKKIYTAISDTSLDEGKTPEKGVIYSDRDTNIIYRWDGTDLVEIGNPIHLGEIAGTAYPGDKGKETTDKVNSHLEDFENPHQVTKAQVGLGDVDNTSDVNKPVSKAQQAALDAVKDELKQNIDSNKETTDNYTINGYKISENPVLDKEDIGLSEVDNTSDLNKPISTATQEALDVLTSGLKAINDSLAQPNGIATLDSNGKLVQAQIPKEAINVLEGKYINETTFNDKQGHPYEPITGVIYVDITSGLGNKMYRWDGSIFAELNQLNDVNSKIDEHISDKNNPHGVTKEQVGLGNVTNDAQVKRSEMGALNGVATLDDNGKIPDSQLPGKVVQVFGIDHFVDSKDQIPTSRLVVGTTYYVKEDKKIYTAISDTTVDEGKTPEKGTIYSNRDTNYIYRWDGTDLVEIGNPIHLGETEGTAYEGNKGKATTDKLNEHVANTENPHNVTKAQVGLANVDNTADMDKPISTATQEALDKITSDVESHTTNKSNPHEVTKAQVGLGNVDNTADLDKPVSNATKELINSTKDSLTQTITLHTENKNNPHGVTKEQVGLANVDNTADLNKPVSIAQQAAIDKVKSEILPEVDKVNSSLTAHVSSENNPHKVTKAQIGLGNVDDTSDENKPVSLAQEARISKVESDLTAKITIHTSDKNNPHEVTKAQIGLGDVDNTRDIDKPISTATQRALDELDSRLSESVTTHIADKSNPHQVTKEQVGLSNVTNDAQVKRSEMGVASGVATLDESGKVPSSQLPSFVDDIVEADSLDEFPEVGEIGKIYLAKDTNIIYRWSGSKYVEISSSLALGETSSTAYPGDKGKATTDKLNEHVANTENPHQVTKEQVGLANVDNTSDMDKPVSTATQAAIDKVKEDLEQSIGEGSETLTSHIANKSNPHEVTKEQVGLGNVDNTADKDKPVSTAQSEAISAAKAEVTKSINDHIADVRNPHGVTKEQVGLGNVDNTSDLNKPVSNATREALSALSDSVTQIVNAHAQNYSNPHQVTKAQVGLDRVDNTNDLEKPVSNATQELVNKIKLDLTTTITSQGEILNAHVADKNNPHSVTAFQIGLGNVNNTADMDKPVSTATQIALDKKADLVDGKVPTTQLPDQVIHSLHYRGFWDADINSPKLENDLGNNAQEGDYYIVRGQGVRFGYEFLPYDIIFNAYGTWYRLSGSNQRDEVTRFDITSFTADKYECEIGENATIKFNWEYNGLGEGENPESQNINGNVAEPASRTLSITDVLADTTFVLSAGYRGISASAELQVKFYSKVYVGTSTNNTVSDSELQAMTSFFDNEKNSLPLTKLDCTGGKYIYVAIPKVNATNYTIYANNILVTDVVETSRNVVNASGGKAEYTIYRLSNKYNGILNIEVKLNK